MEQQQFRVSFSIGTKLLLSIVLLLFLVIVFLNLSAILLLKEDKRAYIYQAQATSAVLAGKDFVNNTKHAIDTLRLSLASFDPTKPVGQQEQAALQSIVGNQSDVLSITVGSLNAATGELKTLARGARDKDLAKWDLRSDDLKIPADWAQSLVPELKSDSFAFVNLSKVGQVPILGILVADLKLATQDQLPVAIGAVSLKDFANQVNGLSLTITSRQGWVLFDTDPTSLFSHKNIADDPLFGTAQASQVATGALEYDSSADHYLGSYVHPGLELVVLARTEWNKAIKATYELTEKFILLGLMAIGAALIFGILFSKTLTAPINRLYQATREVAKGNFNLSLEEKGKDEIGALTSSFNVMSRQISELIKEREDKVRLENELAIASTVQQTLIPPPNFKNEYLQIRSHYQSAAECGGDWWGYFGVGKKICLMISDATGHGLPSALITASARSCFSVMHKLAQEDPEFTFSPSAMLSYANRVIYDASLGKIMMTFFIAVIDCETRTLTYSSAGHNPPWLFKKQGDGYKLNSLTMVGQRLGESRDAPEFQEKALELADGDILFLYTDGLLEGQDKGGEQYGKKRMRKAVEPQLAAGPDAVVDELMKDFLKHNDGKMLDDDVTVAVLKFGDVSPVASTHIPEETAGLTAPTPVEGAPPLNA